MVEIGRGTLIEGIIDEYPNPQPVKSVALSTKRANRLLGTHLERNRIRELLESIEFKVELLNNNEDGLIASAPAFRFDITRPEDLMEEVARLYGYSNVPATHPAMPAEGRPPARRLVLRNRLKRLMSGFGFSEVITYSFDSETSCNRLQIKAGDPRRSMIHILNPLTDDQTVMRTSLVPGILSTMAYNMARQIKNLKLFEIGKAFLKTDTQSLPLEPELLIALWSGARDEASWYNREIPCDFYDIKGIAEGLLRGLKIEGTRFTKMPAESCEYTRPGYTAQIVAADSVLGLVGEIHPRVLGSFDLKQTAYIFELELDKIAELIPQTRFSKPIPRFPAIYRDITIIIDRGIETQTVLETAAGFNEKLVEHLHLFDVFEGEPIAAGKKSVSFRVTYRSSDKTLVDQDVNELHKSITDKLLTAFEATLP
jgi:phenylalanyl-tRNA synthetase beta chain